MSDIQVITIQQISTKKKNLQLYKRNLAAENVEVTHKPLEIFLEMANSCNIHCVMCPINFDDGWDKRREMSRFHIERVAGAFLSAIRVLPFGLGEPMMNRDFMWTVEKAKLAQCYVTFFTNATLLTKEKAEMLVKFGVDRITFSIDAGRRETFQRIRRGASLDVVVRNIEALKETKKKQGNLLPEFEINFVAMNENFEELSELVDLAAKLGVTLVDVKPLETHGRLDLERMKKTSLSPKDQIIILEAKKLAYDRGVILNLGAFEGSLSKGETKSGESTKTSSPPSCFMPWRTIYVRCDGKVNPCCFARDELILGDLNDESIEEIWNGTRSRTLRQMWSRGNPPDRCSYCTGFPMRSMTDDIEEVFRRIRRRPFGVTSRLRDRLKSIIESTS